MDGCSIHNKIDEGGGRCKPAFKGQSFFLRTYSVLACTNWMDYWTTWSALLIASRCGFGWSCSITGSRFFISVRSYCGQTHIDNLRTYRQELGAHDVGCTAYVACRSLFLRHPFHGAFRFFNWRPSSLNHQNGWNSSFVPVKTSFLRDRLLSSHMGTTCSSLGRHLGVPSACPKPR